MDYSLLLTIVAAAIGFFTLFRKFRFHQDKKDVESSSSSPDSPLSSLSPLVAFSPLSNKCSHQVFPSFHGADVRKAFLSHILKEFRRKGIEPFIDNSIERSKSIGPELEEAIRGSKIAVVLLSKNYASSSWCLSELVEIMKCREGLGQTVMTVFYEVDPTEVKKQTGDFWKAFKKTCKGKSEEEIRRWKQALAEVGQIAGYHSSSWDTEAAMIDKITTDISNKLNYSTPSRDFDGLVGMEAHMEKLEQFLCLDMDDVRMIGIWGPPGIGKTTIARFLFDLHSDSFDLSVFMENIKAFMYARPACSDDHSLKLYLQQQLMSQIFNQKDIEIPRLGVVQHRLKEKRVLVILDDVDQSVQLEAMAKETRWFGCGSRIIITTQDKRLLSAHGIEDIYHVDFPPTEEALQIFCMNAFGQNFPKDGFEELASEVIKLSGNLPLGLKIMGSYLRRMSKQEWTNELPWLKTHLDGEIESILKFSYDALSAEDKDLFLHIACFFNNQDTDYVEDLLAKKLWDVKRGLRVLAEKSLIDVSYNHIRMHNTLARLGRKIVRKESIHKPGKRQFLVDTKEICEVLTHTTGSRNVIGIDLDLSEIDDHLVISERAFEVMYNLQFLKLSDNCTKHGSLFLPQGLKFSFQKLRLLHWPEFRMTCLPSNFQTKFLVELDMRDSKLEKLWEGNQPLGNLKWMDLSSSKNLRELPDLSTAINLQKLNLWECSNLLQLPSSIGNATNLSELVLSRCSSLMELPFSIGNATSLKNLYLGGCSSLAELPSSIGKATNLDKLDLEGCSSLVELPSSIGDLHKLRGINLKGCSKLETLPTINLESLNALDLTDCSSLKGFPEMSTNVKFPRLRGTAIEVVPPLIRSCSGLSELQMPYCEKLKELPHALESITMLYFSNTQIQEIPPWVKNMTRLGGLVINGCSKLVSLPQLPDSVSYLDAKNCESLERLVSLCHLNAADSEPLERIDVDLHYRKIYLNFANCFKLDKEARNLIIKTSSSDLYSVVPGGEIPAYFTNRAVGGSLTVKLNEKSLPRSLRFKTCILLAKVDEEDDVNSVLVAVSSSIKGKDNGLTFTYSETKRILSSPLAEHLYSCEFEAEVTCDELVFEFRTDSKKWEIGGCGVRVQSIRVPQHVPPRRKKRISDNSHR